MGDADREGVQTDMDVVVCVIGSEPLSPDTNVSPTFSNLEAKKKSRLYNYLYGPYQQHQFLVDCIQQLKKYNGVDAEVKGRMLWVAPNHTSRIGRLFSWLLWYLNICLPFLFIALGFLCYDIWLMCCCAIFLCVLISCHSIAIFFVLHNQKISLRAWFVSKVDLDHYFGRENKMVKVTLDNATSMQFLSAGQKSRVIARLARSKDKRGMLMMCSKSFWISHIQDPLLGFLFLLIISLTALIVNIDLIRRRFL